MSAIWKSTRALVPAIARAVPFALLLVAGYTAQAQQVAPAAPFHDPYGKTQEQVLAAGASIFQGTCSTCHDNPASHAPGTRALGMLTPESVLRALTDGRMKAQAAALTEEQRADVAQFVSGRVLGQGQAIAAPLMCTGAAAQFDWSKPPVFPGWGFDRNNSHLIAAALARLNPGNIGRLKLKWAFAFPNAVNAHSQPALAGGAIYVGGNDGTLYVLDAATGCARWTYAASAAVRTAITVGPWTAGDTAATPLVYFGDSLGNAYALEAATGREVWKTKIDGHQTTTLTGTPALYDDVLYVPVSSLEEPAAIDPQYACCTFRGSLLALNARTGAEIWRSYMIDEPARQIGTTSAGTAQFGPSGVAIWSTPVIDPRRSQIYVTTGDNYSGQATPHSDAIVALDLRTGAIKWSNQAEADDVWNASCAIGARENCPQDNGPDHDFGSASVLSEGSDGTSYLLAGQKSGVAYAINPDTGEQVWHRRVGRGGVYGGIHFGIAAANDRVYVPVSDFEDGVPHDWDPRPGVYALDIKTGEPVWSAPSANVCAGKALCQPGYSAAISVTPDLLFAGSTDGHLRIFNAASGAVLWDLDTDIPYTTVNGTTGHGGSMSGGSAPIAYDGTLIFNSGYAFLGKMPGNVLLVYTAE
ncbi:MAG: PQQ-binding-like beta-propeller repeat protein [Croceibacterium sp.]